MQVDLRSIISAIARFLKAHDKTVVFDNTDYFHSSYVNILGFVNAYCLYLVLWYLG